MEDRERVALENLVLAPYVQKATALIGHGRRVGGNQFRHAMATFAILVDYGYTNPIMLKAAVIHDLFEDVPETDPRTIAAIDADGPAVVRLVNEVTRGSDESKPAYLARVRDQGTRDARIVKVADRISNLTDLHATIFDLAYMRRYIDETGEYVLPMAQAVAPMMAIEIADLMQRRTGSTSAPGDASKDTS